MTVIAPIAQAINPALPPKTVRLFCDDYLEDRIEIYTDNSFFIVEHSTNVEIEGVETDGWSYTSDSHCSRSNGKRYMAYTNIKAVKILIADGVESECIKAQLPSYVLDQIKNTIESLAEKYAKDADDE